jgi:hypothetical protein
MGEGRLLVRPRARSLFSSSKLRQTDTNIRCAFAQAAVWCAGSSIDCRGLWLVRVLPAHHTGIARDNFQHAAASGPFLFVAATECAGNSPSNHREIVSAAA